MTEMTRRLTLYIILLLAATLPAAAGIRHPGLLFTPEKVAAAKARIATDPAQADAWKSIRKEADGWTTDAYMLAVSYPKGGSAADPERIFINYGSSLRRGDNVYFSSLSKLNAVYNCGEPDMELEVNGQPRNCRRR